MDFLGGVEVQSEEEEVVDKKERDVSRNDEVVKREAAWSIIRIDFQQGFQTRNHWSVPFLIELRKNINSELPF